MRPTRKRNRAARLRPACERASSEKLHPRNRHRDRYDFARLIQADSELERFVAANAHGDASIDFADAAAVKALNRALLRDSYAIEHWDLPAGALCPPIPGRSDHLHYLADLLSESNRGVVPTGRQVTALDIGTGASCVYPLIGASEFGWHFVATDIDTAALANAQAVLDANPRLARQVTLRRQPSSAAIFAGVVLADEWFDLTLCNPPFYASAAEAAESTRRKWQKLGRSKAGHDMTPERNFGGAGAELWCPGGEEAFVAQMVAESAQIPKQCLWFSALLSKSASLPATYAALERAGVSDHRTIAMSQGQKHSRLVAWTYLTAAQQAAWCKLRWRVG